MIHIIHGNDNIASRKHFLSLKDENSSFFDAENLNLIELKQAVEGSELFSNSTKVFIDNLFTKKGIKNLLNVSDIVNSIDCEIFLWANKDIEAKHIKEFKKSETNNFKIPQNIWNFLSSIKPKSNSVPMFHKVLEEADVEIIFSMIIRQFRLLLGVSSNSKRNIDEVKRLAPWQKSRLISQATLFNVKNLKEIYNRLQIIDKDTKTGKSKLSLQQNIDILLSDI